MKIRHLHERKRNDAKKYTIYGIDRETLSLLTINAAENIARESETASDVVRQVNNSLLKVITRISAFLNQDTEPGATEEIPS